MKHPEIVVYCAECNRQLDAWWSRQVCGMPWLAVKPCAHCAARVPCPLLRGDEDQRSLHAAVESFRKASE